jgi:hypothetical protein
VTFATAPLPETFQIRVFFPVDRNRGTGQPDRRHDQPVSPKTVTPLQYSLAIVAAMTTPRCGRSRRTHGQAESQ